VLRGKSPPFTKEELFKVFQEFLDFGLQGATVEEVSNADKEGDHIHHQDFCEFVSSADPGNPRHLRSIVEVSRLESFLFFFYGFVCGYRSDDVRAFAEGLREAGLSPEEQIALYIQWFENEGVPAEELDFVLIVMLARASGTDVKALAQKHEVIAEYLEEYYEEDI
jgi:hypothetical protein